ncbi:sugar ABC transporter permease [uncultured Sphaerochaeta sp.]|uniref:carbohydrate ABC transporter permease n=1 Tax=uncultured Sphaerochaeta sp. TaxID=886478 RepID=UPI002A0A392E|nr:sugar ABC transporter permease [uncultured Sphaerochaeta sp.]
MLLFFVSFVIIPMGMGIITSFFNYTMSSFQFIGLKNYIDLFKDAKFLRSFWNTFVIVVVSVPSVTVFSLWVSSIIYDKNAWVTSSFRGVFYLPVVTGTVPVVVVWKWIFDKYAGILNYILISLGIIDKNISWLGNKDTAIWCILAILFTTSIGQPIVLYISALANVDTSVLEAAEVDGASKMRTFWQVKWPSIMPTTLYVVVITTINSFQCFALIQLLTSGGPVYSTSTIMYYLYDNAFSLYRYGYANAMGVLLAIVIGFFSVLQFKSIKSNVDY